MERDRAAAVYFTDMAATEVRRCFHDLAHNDDESMLAAASAALKYSEQLPNGRFAIPEASPVARGTGRRPPQDGIKQFPGDRAAPAAPAAHTAPGGSGNGNGAVHNREAAREPGVREA